MFYTIIFFIWILEESIYLSECCFWGVQTLYLLRNVVKSFAMVGHYRCSFRPCLGRATTEINRTRWSNQPTEARNLTEGLWQAKLRIRKGKEVSKLSTGKINSARPVNRNLSPKNHYLNQHYKNSLKIYQEQFRPTLCTLLFGLLSFIISLFSFLFLQIELRKSVQERDKNILDLKVRNQA